MIRKNLPRPNNSGNDVLDVYIFFSFCASILLWFGQYFINPNFLLIDGFFISAFVIGSYHFWAQSGLYPGYLKTCPGVASLFVFQSFCLMGFSFSTSELGGIYLSLVPPIYVWYVSSFLKEEQQLLSNKKAVVLICLVFSSYLLFSGLTKVNMLANQQGLFIAVFLFWSIGTFYKMAKGMPLAQVLPFKRETSRDRLFFHDVINQTHSLNLFLGHRLNVKKGLSVEECSLVANEIKLLQAIIREHFGFRHRNLSEMHDHVSFEFAKEGIHGLIESYLPEATCRLVFVGEIADEVPLRIRERCTVNYPILIRILTNLVKNISEAQAQEVEVIFDYQQFGLNIVIRNKIFKLNDDPNVANRLKELILVNESDERFKGDGGIGLEAVASICAQQGGSFYFSLEEDYWVNRVFLPHEQRPFQKIA